MARQECSLIALSMPGAEHQRGHRLTVGPEDPARRGPGSDIMAPEGAARRGSGSDIMAPEGGFRAEIFFNREIYTSRRGIPLKMGNFVRVLSNFAPKALPVRAPGSYFVGPEGAPATGFGAEIFFYMEIYVSRWGVPPKCGKTAGFCRILLRYPLPSQWSGPKQALAWPQIVKSVACLG